MDQLTEIKRMLADHMEQSNEKHTEVMVALTKLETNEKTNHKRITDLETDNTKIQSIKNQGKGIVLIITIIWAVLTFGIPLAIGIYFKSH